jgi:hypothetical protein
MISDTLYHGQMKYWTLWPDMEYTHSWMDSVVTTKFWNRWTLSSALAVNISFMMWMMLYLPTDTLSCSAFSRVSTAWNASYWSLSLLWRLQSGMESTNPLQVYGILLYIINFSPLQILLIFFRQYISRSLRRNSLNYEKEIGLYICPYIHQGKNTKCILVASKTSLWFQYLSLLTTMHV